MLTKKIRILMVLAATGLVMAACTLSADNQTSTNTPPNAGTAVAETLAYQMTQLAVLATNTPLPPSPTATNPLPSSTLAPTNTPQPTATRTPAPTATSVPCNQVGFIGDVTVPDGSLFLAGTEFSKVWRLRNTGSCPWTANYELVYYSGERMQGASVTSFNTRVEPGEMIDVGVELTAPTGTGKHLGYWMLRTAGGSLFGLGASANQPFWVEIRVIGATSPGVYSFAENICAARWSDNQDAPLPCQGAIGPEDNVVRLSNRIEMETGVTEDEVGLWINLGNYGEVTGMFPAMVVQAGDRFVAEIGCIDDSKDCHARFTLSYKEVGTSTIVQLNTWVEDYDDDTTVINVDLGTLVGKNVKFILQVESLTNHAETEVFWFVPRIQNP